MRYRVVIAKVANHQIKKLSRQVQKKVVHILFELAENPRPRGVVKLKGADNLYRIRTGDYRIIYSIKDDDLVVLATSELYYVKLKILL